jgi:hypothetical protein
MLSVSSFQAVLPNWPHHHFINSSASVYTSIMHLPGSSLVQLLPAVSDLIISAIPPTGATTETPLSNQQESEARAVVVDGVKRDDAAAASHDDQAAPPSTKNKYE